MNIETNRIEYKQIVTDDLEKEVVAFLNYPEGGIIFLGIDKHGKVLGVQDPDQLQLKIKDRIKHNILPSALGLFDIILEELEGKNAIKIVVASGSEKPYYIKKYGMSEKGCYLRIGSAAEPMPIKTIENLFAKRTRNTISKIKSSQQQLKFEQLKIYYDASGKQLNHQFAKNLELLTEDGKYNYVGYLMADNNTVSIKLAKYNGLNRVELLENNEYGFCSLVKAAKQVLDKVELENKTLATITPKERQEKRPWNAIALREAIINAFVHSDYTREIPPKFEFFKDRLEITSAGGLPEGLSQDEFFEGYSVPRNKELMRIFKDLDLVEHLGSGIPRILQTYGKECFHFSENFIRMAFPSSDQANDQVNDQVNDQARKTEKSILDIIKHILGSKPTTEEVQKYKEVANSLSEEQIKVLEFASSPESNKKIQEEGLNLKRHNDNFKKYIEPLLAMGALARTLPDIPNSPLQKYFITAKGKILLEINQNPMK